MNTIMTLCGACAEALESSYRVKPVASATTAKSRNCDNCHKGGLLMQYLVKDKGGKKR